MGKRLVSVSSGDGFKDPAAKRKQYSSKRTLIRKSIGFQLDFQLPDSDSSSSSVFSAIDESAEVHKDSEEDLDNDTVHKLPLDDNTANEDDFEETRKLSAQLLSVRKRVVSSFADPSFNTEDPMKTYDIKAINEKYRGLEKRSKLCNVSKSTFERANKVKNHFDLYYTYLEKYTRPVRVKNEHLSADQSPESPNNTNNTNNMRSQEQPVVCFENEDGFSSVTLGWNPVQVIRNRKVLKKYHMDTMKLDSANKLPSLATKGLSKDIECIWVIGIEELITNYYWSIKYWYLVKNGKHQLTFKNGKQGRTKVIQTPILSSPRQLFSRSNSSHRLPDGTKLKFQSLGSKNTSSSPKTASTGNISQEQTPSPISGTKNSSSNTGSNSLLVTNASAAYNGSQINSSTVLSDYATVASGEPKYKKHATSSSTYSIGTFSGKSGKGKLGEMLSEKATSALPKLSIPEINLSTPVVSKYDPKLSDIAIEPISNRRTSMSSSTSSLGLVISPNSKKIGAKNEIDTNPVQIATSGQHRSEFGGYLSPYQTSAGHTASKLSFADGKIDEVTDMLSRKSALGHVCDINEFTAMSAHLDVMSYHLRVQRVKHNELIAPESIEKCTQLSQKLTLLDKYIEWVNNLLPIYMKSLAKEIEKAAVMKSQINDYSNRIDTLLFSSDRLVSMINTKLNISIKQIGETLNTNNRFINKNILEGKHELLGNQFVSGVIEYSIIIVLYLIWLFLSVVRLVLKLVGWSWRSIKWVFF